MRTCWTLYLPELWGKYSGFYWNDLVKWSSVVIDAKYGSILSSIEYGDNNDDFKKIFAVLSVEKS